MFCVGGLLGGFCVCLLECCACMLHVKWFGVWFGVGLCVCCVVVCFL